MWKNLLLVILAGIFVGCSTSAGNKFNIAAADRIVVGQTTESDVVAMAGLPLYEQKLGDGTKIYHYTYGRRCPINNETTTDKMQVRIYNGVIINKWADMEDY